MKFKAYGRMQSAPTVELDAKIDPLKLDTTAGGSLQGQVGPFVARVGEIPIRVTVPFLRRRRPVLASVGGFRIKLDAVQLEVASAAVDIKGVVGADGIDMKANAKVDCDTDMKVKGWASGQVNLPTVDLGEEPEPEPEDDEAEIQ